MNTKIPKTDVLDGAGLAASDVHKIPLVPDIEDRRVGTRPTAPGGIAERRQTADDRRRAPRLKRLKGAQIEWPAGNPVACVVRNISETGAQIEVHGTVPDDFTLVFDADQSRFACHVMWRKPPRIGVAFQPLESVKH